MPYFLSEDERLKLLNDIPRLDPDETLNLDQIRELTFRDDPVEGIRPEMKRGEAEKVLREVYEEAMKKWGDIIPREEIIVDAKEKILMREREIEALKEQIQNEQQNIKKIRQETTRRGRGRPKKTSSNKKAVKMWVATWIQSLQKELGTNTCAGLDKAIHGSDERSWNRWINGSAIPTSQSFDELLKLKVGQNLPHAGKYLSEVPTVPESKELALYLKPSKPSRKKSLHCT
jgi:hypothetical protein